MTSPIKLSLASVALLFTLAGCSHELGLDDAAEAYAAHRATVDDVARSLREGVKRLPHVQPMQCEDPAEVARANDPARTAALDACATRRGQWHIAALDAWAAFRASVPVGLLDRHDDILALRLELRIHEGSTIYPVTIGVTTPARPIVDAAHGLSRDGRKIGLNFYVTAAQWLARGGETVQVGDAEQRLGTEVTWTFREGAAGVKVTLVILNEGKMPDAWRAANRERLSH